MGKSDHNAALSELRELCVRLSRTAATYVDDPQYITNRATAHYGERQGLLVVLRAIARHLKAPQIIESDGSTHSEDFIPGVGPVQLSCWPGDYFADGESPYLALMFAEAANAAPH